MEGKRRIFLTGVNGFLGSHVALKLAEEGHRVLGLIRGDTPSSPLLLKKNTISYCKGELLEPRTYDDALRECDTVIHSAAITSFALKDPGLYYKVNYEGTRFILGQALKTGIRRFIYVSTRGTLGAAARPEESDENCKNKDIQAADDYIKSKYRAEQEVLRCARETEMPCLVLSPTALVGECDYRPTPVGRIILSFLQRKIRVYLDGGINLIDVEDAAQAFVSVLEKGRNGEIYILGNENITLRRLFLLLSEISNIPAPKIKINFPLAYLSSFAIEAISRLTGRPPFSTPKKVSSLYHNHSYCSSGKAMEELGLVRTPLRRSLEKAVSWYKENNYF